MSTTTFVPTKHRKERALGLGVYTSRQVSRLSAVPVRSLGYWRKTDLVAPRIERGAPGHPALYTYIDLCELRVIAQLRREGLALQRIRKAIRYLKSELTTGESWYRAYKLRTDGFRLFTLIRADDQRSDLVTVETGAPQKVVVVYVGDIVKQFETDPDLAHLREFSSAVDIRPDVLAGAPVVRHTRIGTGLIASLLAGGWTKEMVVRAYPTLTPEGVEKARRFEEVIGAQRAA